MDNNLDATARLASSDAGPLQSIATPPATATTTTQPSTANIDTTPMIASTTAITKRQQNILNKLDLAPATLEALKTLSIISSHDGVGKLSSCNKLTASLERLRAKKNINLFEKLDRIKQEFSGINHKVSQMENSIMDMRKDTNNLVKSLPNSQADARQPSPKQVVNPKQPSAAQTQSGK